MQLYEVCISVHKICRSFVSRLQIPFATSGIATSRTSRYLPDHGLPLVQLKEQRRTWSSRCKTAIGR